MTEAPFLIAALVLAGIWGAYLFPSIFGGRRDAPLNSTEEFDRWTHLMADVQRRPYNARRSSTRNVIRARRRRTLFVLGVIAVGTLAMAFLQSSVNWLLAHIAVDAVIAWYVAMLSQLKSRQVASKVAAHVVEAPREGDDHNVRVVAGG
jgi:hypothetical protein